MIVFELIGDSTLPALSSARHLIVVVAERLIGPLEMVLEPVGSEPSIV